MPGLKSNVTLTRDLRDEVIDKMVHQIISKIVTAGQLSHITYNRANQNSAIQEKDDLDEQQQKDNYITIIIPFTNLDVYINMETTTAKDAVHSEMVLCYIKPYTSLLIKKGVQYRFQANTLIDKRWLDIKFIP